MKLCQCYNDECNDITEEEFAYLEKIDNNIYYKPNYFIMSIDCAIKEMELGESTIIHIHGNAALTKWIV